MLTGGCCCFRERFGSFTYAAPRTPYIMPQGQQAELAGSCASSSSSSKLSHRRKKLLRVKRPLSSATSENESRPAVKLVVKFSSASNKQPSVVSKTASAVKLRYSSIISTRRASNKPDFSVTKPAAVPTAEVTDCVVNIERLGISSTVGGISGADVNCTDDGILEITADISDLPAEAVEQAGPAAECGDDVLMSDSVLCADAEENVGIGAEMKSNHDADEIAKTRQRESHDTTDVDVEKQRAVSEEELAVKSGAAEAEFARAEHYTGTSDNTNECTDVGPLTAKHHTDCDADKASDKDSEVATESGLLIAKHKAVTDNDGAMDTAVITSEHQAVVDDRAADVVGSVRTKEHSGSDKDTVVENDSRITSICENYNDSNRTDDRSHLPPCSDAMVNNYPSIAVASSSSISDSVKPSNAESVGLVECCNLLSTANADVSRTQSLTNITCDMSVPEKSAVTEMSVDILTSAQVSNAAECGMDIVVTGCVTAQETSTDARSEDVNSSLLHSVCLGCDSSADNVSLMCVNEASNANLSELECSHGGVVANDTEVAGVLSMGTDLECDEEDAVETSLCTSTLSQPPLSVMLSCSYPSNTDSSLPCSNSQFPFVESIMAHSQQSSVDNAHKSDCCWSAASAVLSADCNSLSSASSCDSVVSVALASCQVSAETLPSTQSSSSCTSIRVSESLTGMSVVSYFKIIVQLCLKKTSFSALCFDYQGIILMIFCCTESSKI